MWYIDRAQKYVKKVGIALEIFVLDNETLKELISTFNEQYIIYKLVTLNKYHNNQSKKVIQTYKDHFKSELTGADLNFPLLEWDRLIL